MIRSRFLHLDTSHRYDTHALLVQMPETVEGFTTNGCLIYFDIMGVLRKMHLQLCIVSRRAKALMTWRKARLLT